MEARLNSLPATNITDVISEKLRQNWNVCQFKATGPEQMLKKKKKKVGHKCCAAANCNN